MKRNTVKNINQNDVNIKNGVDSMKQREEEERGGGNGTLPNCQKKTTFMNSLYSTIEIPTTKTNTKKVRFINSLVQIVRKGMWA